MTNVEVQEKLKVGYYGILKFGKTTTFKQIHGKIKYVDSNGTIVFKDNDANLFLVYPEHIKSFDVKEMLPKPTEYKGEEVYWSGGRYYYKVSNKECDLNR